MEIVECPCEVVKQIPTLFRLYHYIINLGFDVSPNLISQDDVYALLICSSPILQRKRHLGITENPERYDEGCFLFVVYGEADLMIA
jgi:hypothetical protein